MRTIFYEIQDLISTTGKAAPDMTAALKRIGNGNMQVGIKKLAKYFDSVGFESGIKLGTKNGMVKGSLVTLGAVSLVACSVFIKEKYNDYKRKKALEDEGKLIYEAIKDSVSKTENSTVVDVELQDCDSIELEEKK